MKKHWARFLPEIGVSLSRKAQVLENEINEVARLEIALRNTKSAVAQYEDEILLEAKKEYSISEIITARDKSADQR